MQSTRTKNSSFGPWIALEVPSFSLPRSTDVNYRVVSSSCQSLFKPFLHFYSLVLDCCMIQLEHLSRAKRLRTCRRKKTGGMKMVEIAKEKKTVNAGN